MIDKDRLAIAQVVHRLEGFIEIPRPLITPRDLNGKNLIRWRIEEIDFTNDYGKKTLIIHSLKQALWTINYYAREFKPPVIKPIRDAKSAFKSMSHVVEELDYRALPALRGLSYFTTPSDLPSKKYEEICSEYNKKVQAIKTRFPSGKGRYKQLCDQLTPEFQKLLSDLKEFFEEALKDYFDEIPDQN